MHNKECLFCKIFNKELPSKIVYETNEVVAFYDIHPVAEGHTLLIHKEHSDCYLNTRDEVLRTLSTEIKNVCKVLTKEFNTEDFNIIVNNGPTAGQIVYHLHIHIIPRKYKEKKFRLV